METEVVFTEFPVLTTERLVLRDVRMRDAKDFFRIFSDHEVVRYYGIEPLTDLEQARQMIRRRRKQFRHSECIRWAITRKGDDRLIGTCGFHTWVQEDFKTEIGYEIEKESWGQGIVPEALQAILAYGYEHMRLNRVEAQIDPANHSSRRVLTKLGFKHEGTFAEHVFIRGKFCDTEVHSLLKAEFMNT